MKNKPVREFHFSQGRQIGTGFTLLPEITNEYTKYIKGSLENTGHQMSTMFHRDCWLSNNYPCTFPNVKLLLKNSSPSSNHIFEPPCLQGEPRVKVPAKNGGGEWRTPPLGLIRNSHPQRPPHFLHPLQSHEVAWGDHGNHVVMLTELLWMCTRRMVQSTALSLHQLPHHRPSTQGTAKWMEA